MSERTDETEPDPVRGFTNDEEALNEAIREMFLDDLEYWDFLLRYWFGCEQS